MFRIQWTNIQWWHANIYVPKLKCQYEGAALVLTFQLRDIYICMSHLGAKYSVAVVCLGWSNTPWCQILAVHARRHQRPWSDRVGQRDRAKQLVLCAQRRFGMRSDGRRPLLGITRLRRNSVRVFIDDRNDCNYICGVSCVFLWMTLAL